MPSDATRLGACTIHGVLGSGGPGYPRVGRGARVGRVNPIEPGLPQWLGSGWIAIPYSLWTNRQEPTLRKGSTPYFVPGEPSEAGMWVRLVLRPRGGREFICIGTLTTATETNGVLSRIGHESGPAPEAFLERRWNYGRVARGDDAAWYLVELRGEMDLDRRRRELAQAIHDGRLERALELVGTLSVDEPLSRTNTYGFVHDEVTPLMLAAKADQLDIVKTLLALGADANAKIRGLSALDWGRRGKADLDLIRYLRGRAKGQEEPDDPLPLDDPLGVGRSVRHKKFGKGVVGASDDDGKARKLTVSFEDGNERLLLARFLMPDRDSD